jgi:mevalonate kinase
MKSIGIGYGKAIIFGEHFVVYGLPGIASSINLITKCTFGKNDNGIISNDLVTGETVIYGQATYKNLDKVIGIILKETGIKERNFRLDLETNMSLKGGMGSSAALCVSITKCLNKQFSLKLSKEEINKISFEAEKVFHKTPSGIDNTVSCYGGIIWFVKAKTQNTIERLKAKPVEIVLADTGKVHDTAEIVEMVKKQKEEEPEKYKKIFQEYEKLVYEGRKALEKGEWKAVGKLMNKNHELLKQINVSNEENDLINEISLKAGALGAKLTGAGLGGNNIALTPGKALQEKVAKAIEKEGFKAYKLKIGVKQK